MKNEKKKTITGIYKITNVINGHAYIGQSVDIERRWRDHKQRSKNKHSKNYDSIVCAAFRKYGLKHFDFEILEKCTVELLNEREIYWISYYDTYHNGYNQTMGGEGYNIDMPENITKVVDDLKNSKLSFTEIAKNNGVSISLVSRINSGENWHDEEATYPIRDTSSKRCVCPICGGKKSTASRTCKNCKNKQTDKQMFGNLNKKVQKNKTTVNYKTKTCRNCGAPTSTVLCLSCYRKEQAKNIPSKDTLIKDLLVFPMIRIGEKYGVSDNAVRKWCRKYGLPTKEKDIKQFRKEYVSEN